MLRRLVALLVGAVGAWFVLSSMLAVAAGEASGAMWVPAPFTALLLGVALVAAAVWIWRGGRPSDRDPQQA